MEAKQLNLPITMQMVNPTNPPETEKVYANAMLAREALDKYFGPPEGMLHNLYKVVNSICEMAQLSLDAESTSRLMTKEDVTAQNKVHINNVYNGQMDAINIELNFRRRFPPQLPKEDIFKLAMAYMSSTGGNEIGSWWREAETWIKGLNIIKDSRVPCEVEGVRRGESCGGWSEYEEPCTNCSNFYAEMGNHNAKKPIPRFPWQDRETDRPEPASYGYVGIDDVANILLGLGASIGTAVGGGRKGRRRRKSIKRRKSKRKKKKTKRR